MLAAEHALGAGRRAPLPAAGALGRRDGRRPTSGVRLDFLSRASAPAPTASASSRPARGSGSTARSATPSPTPRTAGQPRTARGGDPRRRRHRDRAAGAPAADASPSAMSPPGSCSASATSALRRPRRALLAAARSRARQRGRPRRPPRLRHRPARRDARRRRRRSRRRLRLRAAGDARGGRALCCAEREVACELAMESPMACGFGACFGCAVPHGRRRLHAPLRRRAGRAAGGSDCRGGRRHGLTSAGSSSSTR